MAKAMGVDKLQSYRFVVSLIGIGNTEYLGVEAAFNTCVVPEATLEQVEYNEGNNLNRIKQPGLPTYGDLTLTRGVTIKDSKFYEWLTQTAVGGEYRADVMIEHKDRAGETQRTYIAYDAFPTRVKLAMDMDAASSEISVQEIDLAYERIGLIVKGKELIQII